MYNNIKYVTTTRTELFTLANSVLYKTLFKQFNVAGLNIKTESNQLEGV